MTVEKKTVSDVVSRDIAYVSKIVNDLANRLHKLDEPWDGLDQDAFNSIEIDLLSINMLREEHIRKGWVDNE